ncbi:MAG TPA: TldD/PmbA family protein [Herpetosiphonaceae bacterium]
MIGSDAIRRITDRVLSASPADQTEVVVIAGAEQLTRFANNEIHQHVSETNAQIRIRAVIGQQIGVAVTNEPAEDSLQRALEAAVEIAMHQPPNPDFTSLPRPQPITPVEGWSQITAACTPQRRADDVATIIRLAEAQGLIAAGAYSTTTRELAVANSLGVWAYHPGTYAQISTVVMGEASGWAAATSRDSDEIDAEAIGREACDKAIRSRNPQPLAPGIYPVVLEPYAVAEMMAYLNMIGFGALALQEGRSPLEIGAQQAASLVTIYDDGSDPTGLPLPFDYEGVPKQPVQLIKKGISTGVVYDTQTAAKDHTRSTGHALAAPNSFGPLALNLFLKPGGTPKAALIKGIERGVYVTRFHYVNIVHPKQSLLTGMTRDGTFLIENGEIAGPIHNLRFTQSVLEALRGVQDISRETVLDRDFTGASCRAPALKIGAFNFSSATEF